MLWYPLLAFSSVWHIQHCTCTKRNLNFLFVEGLWCTDVPVNETSGPAMTGQHMMLAPASFLELTPRSPSGLVLSFYSVTDQVLNSGFLSLCSAWLWYKVKPGPAVYYHQNNMPSCSTNRENTIQKCFAEVSPFLCLLPWSAIRQECSSSPCHNLPAPLCCCSSSRRGLRGSPRHTNQHSCPSFSHQSTGRKGGDFCNSRALQAVFSSRIAK